MPNTPVKILYVDDDPALARLVQKALGRRGYEVLTAGSTDEGLARVELGGIDVIALDHYLPTGTGLDLIETLKGRELAPPVVYVTGSAETAVAVAALKAGASDYVPKTVEDEFLELLVSAIEQALEKARLQRDKARAEREVREARDRAELLLGEVNHRVANSLALVASLVRMQANQLPEGEARDALSETQARITAIAGIHRRLYTSDDVRHVQIDEYLASLVEELDISMKAAGHSSTIKLDAEKVAVPTDKAVSIGVIVTELVTNAFKYAYGDSHSGEVRVGLWRRETSALLSVEDDGIGWNGEGKAKGTGLGSRVVKAMALNLGTSVVYDASAGGTRVTLDFPLQEPDAAQA